MTAEGIRRVTLPQLPDSAAIVRDEVVEPRAEQCIPTQAVDSHRYYSPWTKISLSKPALREQKRDALLPAYTARSHVMSISCTMNPKLVEGDTGSGKSTQVPQLIAEGEADLPGTSLIWISTSRVKACMGLQERLSYVTEDRKHTKCISAYQGTYPNVLCPREQEVVAVHTTATALLRIHDLFQECVRRKESNDLVPHLIVDEAGDPSSELLINAGLLLQKQALLKVWVMSATMPQHMLDFFSQRPCDHVNLGGLPHALRVVTVECNRDEWLPLAKTIVRAMRRPGHSSVLFVTSAAECEAYAKEVRHESENDLLQTSMQKTVTPVYGRNDGSVSDSSLSKPVHSHECRTYVTTDKLAASNTLPSLLCVVNPGIAKRPAQRAGVNFLRITQLTMAENKQRQGRGARTQASIAFQFVFRGMTNLVADEEDVLDEDTSLDWLLRAIRVASSLGVTLQTLADTLPTRVRCINTTWSNVCKTFVARGVVCCNMSQTIVLSPLGQLLASICLPFHLSLFLVMALMLQSDVDDVDDMWHCAVSRILFDP